ncbi:MAG: hypothetical protein WCI11_17200 [Candidatus Methylumidiphilus sp.]
MPKKIVDLNDFKIEVEDGKFVGDLNDAKAMVQDARAKLARVIAWGITKKDQPRFKLCMETYFRVPPTATEAVYNAAARTVMANLNELNIELQSNELTLSPVVLTDATADAAAYVMRHIPDALKDAVFGDNPLKRASFYGAIHLRFDKLHPVGTAAGNLIHEGTHRFLGTRDWSYAVNFDMIGYEETHRNMGIEPPTPPKSVNSIKAWYEMSVSEALNNADSYAGFVIHLTCT